MSYKYHEQILLGCGRRPPFENRGVDGIIFSLDDHFVTFFFLNG